jgi:NIPSNAP
MCPSVRHAELSSPIRSRQMHLLHLRHARLAVQNGGLRLTAQRKKLARDPEWAAFTPKILLFLVHQESIFLTPVAFSPLK